MEDGLHDYGITARSGGSGAKYLSRGYPFAGQPTVDGGDDADQPFGVEGDDSTLGIFLTDSPLTSQLIRTRNKSRLLILDVGPVTCAVIEWPGIKIAAS